MQNWFSWQIGVKDFGGVRSLGLSMLLLRYVTFVHAALNL
jgi:hypothetical protein